MCFSAPVSGLVGATLCVGGLVTLRLVRRPTDVPIALLPLLFGLQQLSEGAVWLALDADAGQTTSPLVSAYLGFALVLWPVYMPFATWRVEPEPRRRRAIAWLGAVGAAVSLYLAVMLAVADVSARSEANRIVYELPMAATTLTAIPYVVATCLPCLLSSLRSINLLGITALVAALVVRGIYERAFVSVWCFAAAVLSGIVLAHVLRKDHVNLGPYTDALVPRARQSG